MTMRKETLAVICDRNPQTSFGRMSLDIKNALSNDFSVQILWLSTPRYFPEGALLPQGSDAIHAPNIGLGFYMFRRPFRRWLNEVRPEKVLFISPELGFLVAEVRRELPKTRVGVMAHDMFLFYRRSIKFKLFIRFFIVPSRKADVFLYNSEYTREETEKMLGCAKERRVVGCPIDTSLFRPRNEGNKASLRQKWGLDRHKGVCLNISFDAPRKNIATFFTLAKMRPQLAFVRVGKFSPWMKKWLERNNINNVIHYSGLSQESLLELYGCADLFIYPSLLEGFGLPPLEALACGVPVVASSCSALKENLEGVAPLVNPPDRAEGYLGVIDDVLAGKSVVNKKAAEELLERFSLDNFGKRVSACFKSDAITNPNPTLP